MTPTHHPCRRYFAAWQAELEHEPDPWFIRDLPHNTVWANSASRKIFDWPIDQEPWALALHRVHIEWAAKLEDAHSLALKTGRTVPFRFTVKLKPHRTAEAINSIKAVTCGCCPRRCSLILVLAEFLPQPVPASENASSS